jgi:hypothetical protein
MCLCFEFNSKFYRFPFQPKTIFNVAFLDLINPNPTTELVVVGFEVERNQKGFVVVFELFKDVH